MSFRIVRDNVPGFRKAVLRMTQDQVLVGIPAKNTEREDTSLTNAALGYIHEFGSPRANIPARPFLYPGVASVQPEITKRLQKAGELALDGKIDAVDSALQGVGMVAASAVQRKIKEGPFVPLSERTLAERRARGVTRTNPLIDTGKLRRAITWVIRRNGSDV